MLRHDKKGLFLFKSTHVISVYIRKASCIPSNIITQKHKSTMAKPLSLITLLQFIFFVIPCLSCPHHQKQSLLQLKSSFLNVFTSTSPPGSAVSSSFALHSWNSTSDCCTWDRVICNSKSVSRNVTALYLDSVLYSQTDQDVNSDILSPIFRLKSLMLLDISNNRLQGEIPAKRLANLTKLVHLDISVNNFSGSIPPQLFRLKFLQHLDLSVNKLQGGLSGQVDNLQNLRTLDITFSQIVNGKFQVGFMDLSRNRFLIARFAYKLYKSHPISFHTISSIRVYEVEDEEGRLQCCRTPCIGLGTPGKNAGGEGSGM